ncbi:MAG: HU family DNA-binding protein [Paracoccaceae bacterium]
MTSSKPTTPKATPRKSASASKAAKPRSAAPAKAAATTKKPALKAVATPAPKPVQPAKPELQAAGLQAVLRKKGLIERVVKVSGAKKKDVKGIVEATLQVLGDALAAGESLALPPLGRAKVNRQKDLATGEMMVVKLRRSSEDTDKAADREDASALAEAMQ